MTTKPMKAADLAHMLKNHAMDDAPVFIVIKSHDGIIEVDDGDVLEITAIQFQNIGREVQIHVQPIGE